MTGTKTKYDYTRLLSELPFWDHLTEDERELIMHRYRILKYDAGAHVRGGGTECLGLIIMLKGSFRAYLLSPEGREMTLYRTRPGEVCILSAACILDAVSFDTHVDAEEDSEVLLVPVDVFSALVEKNVHVECFSYKMATERFSDVVSGVERLVFLSIEQRIAAFLLEESAQTGSETIYMTHEHIALNIGSAREVVSRTLKGMVKHGLVELFRGGVRILNKASMAGVIGDEIIRT